MSSTFRSRLSLTLVLLSACTIAFLVSRGYDLHWIVVLLWSSMTGGVAGFLRKDSEGALIGAAAGLFAGILLIPAYGVFWLLFDLPPYPDPPL